MNTFLRFDGIDVWQLAGWTMLHFLWLGVAVALLAAGSRLVLRRAAPAVRYTVALSCFALLAAAPGGIAAWLVAHRPAVEATTVQIAAANMPAQVQTYGKGVPTAGTDFEFPTYAVPLAPGSASQPADVAEQLAPAAPLPTYAAAVLATCVPYLPWLWIVGAPITFALLATGVVGADRLRRTSQVIGDGPIVEACQRLLEQLRITRRVTVAVCERIAAPVLVGVLRPVILLPPAALTGWSPDEIEMVLLHELAHVRRWDNLVNLLQRLVESLLFFHPVVWLLSGWVRREREACCDAVVVGRTNRPHAYAEMLVALAAQMPRSVLFHPAASSAMAAGPLRSRIRRILQLEDDPMLISGKSLTLAVGSLVLVTALMVLYLPARGQAEDSAIEAKGMATEVTENTEFAESMEEHSDNKYADAFDDLARVRELFKVDSTNPLQTRTYHLSLPQRKLMPDVFEGFKKDPYGPQVQFESTWSSDGSQVTIVAPRDAQKFLARGLELKLAGEGGQEQAVVEHQRQIEMTTASGEHVLAESQDGRLRVQIRNRRSGQFPTLEEQKLADLAWKMLGLELEKISSEDLQRVQALDYEDGLRVTGGQSGRFGVGENGIHTGDILVGLHVWPTTSFEAVADVLNRDDLGDLEPLKYYVVRPGRPQDGAFISGPQQDTVVTGRIVVGPAVTGELRRPQPKEGEWLNVMRPEPPKLDATIDAQIPAPTEVVAKPREASRSRLTEVAARRQEAQDRIAAAAQRLREAQAEQAELEQKLLAMKTAAAAKFSDERFAKLKAEGKSTKDAKQYDESAEHYLEEHLQKQMKEVREHIKQVDREVEKQTRAILEQSEQMQKEFRRVQEEAKALHIEAEEQYRIQVERLKHDNTVQDIEVHVERPATVSPPDAPQTQIEPPVPAAAPAPNALLDSSAAPTPHAPQSPKASRGSHSLRMPHSPEPTVSGFPYAVRFEQGASRFLDGDKITVLDIRGTAETFKPGNLYWIKGTYKLGSHDRARLDAYTTAKDAADGRSQTWKIQTTNVDRGSGTFELFLPYSYEGWPHVSFYPADGGDGFGGTYFGTGDSVLRKWWGPNWVTDRTSGKAVWGPNSNHSADKLHKGSTPRVPDEDLFGSAPAPQTGPPTVDDPAVDEGFRQPQVGTVVIHSPKSDLRYEDKTFDEWQNILFNELSPERRLDAVNALAAFSRAGYGEQAAEAILDIAGQYDFRVANERPEGKLNQTILHVLVADGGSMVPYWMPDLAQRLKKNPRKWNGLAAKLLMNVRTDNDKAIEVLQSLAESGPADLRLMALHSLVQSSHTRSGGPKLDDKTLSILTQALHSKDPQMVYAATSFLFDGGNYLAYLSELPPLLFYPDAKVRKHARDILHRLSASDAAQIEGELISVLDDPARQDDHIAAVRALGAIGNHAESAIPQLERILNDSVDVPLRVAAGIAIDKIEHGGRGRKRLLELSDSMQDERQQTRLTRLFNEEHELQNP